MTDEQPFPGSPDDMMNRLAILDRVARAVLLFHRGGPWTDQDHALWFMLTDTSEVTTKALCNFVRKAIQ